MPPVPNPEAIRTRIGFFNDAAPLREPAFRVINLIQDEQADVQILALATSLYAVCDALQLDPHDLLQKVDRARHHIDGPFQSHFKAIREYAQGELTHG